MHTQWVYYKMEDQVHGSYAEALFEAVLMTNETTMFPQSSCTPVKAEPFYWVANATREARSQLLCTYLLPPLPEHRLVNAS